MSYSHFEGLIMAAMATFIIAEAAKGTDGMLSPLDINRILENAKPWCCHNPDGNPNRGITHAYGWVFQHGPSDLVGYA
jgi:hypothetical protein